MKENWTYKKLGEVCEVLDSKRKPITKSDRQAGNIPYYGATGVQDYVKDFIFDGRFLLVGEDGAKWGKDENTAYIIEGKSWVNNHAHILKLHDSVLDTFVRYYLNGKDLTSYITGAVVQKLTQAALISIPIPVPPLETQSRIVSELDLLQSILDKQQAQLKELDTLAQAVFYDMFGDPVENEKGWEVKTIEDVCQNIVDCPHSTPKKVDGKTQYPCIRTSELRGGIVSWETMQYLDENEYKKRIARLAPKDGDIVFGREGTIGDAVILPKGYYFSLGQRTMLLRVNTLISNVFLHRVLMSEWIKRQILYANVSSTVAHVNIKDFKKFVVPVPPLSLQQEFAEKIESIEKQKDAISQSMAETQKLFDYTMDKYFGE